MMARNRSAPIMIAITTVWLIATAASARGASQVGADDGWQIPAAASTEANPLAGGTEVIARGRTLYRSKCQRCHGAAGKGDGPDADSDHRPADLSDARRAPRNPDGILFYKIWNGRAKPRMPAMKADLSRGDVWALIHYVKTLRVG